MPKSAKYIAALLRRLEKDRNQNLALYADVEAIQHNHDLSNFSPRVQRLYGELLDQLEGECQDDAQKVLDAYSLDAGD